MPGRARMEGENVASERVAPAPGPENSTLSTDRGNRLALVVVGSVVVIGSIFLAGYDSGPIVGGLAYIARDLSGFWQNAILPLFRGMSVLASQGWGVLLQSVSFVGPNLYLRTLVLTMVLGVIFVAICLAIAVLAGPLSGRKRWGPNPLLPPVEPPGSAPAFKTDEGGSKDDLADGESCPVTIPLTPENRSQLLHTAGSLRQIVRERPEPERSRLNLDLFRAEDFIVTNRLNEAYSILERVSRAVADGEVAQVLESLPDERGTSDSPPEFQGGPSPRPSVAVNPD
jgi:hypothetical protein